MTCENSDGDGCRSCITSLLRPQRRTDAGRDCHSVQNSDAAGIDRPYNFTECQPVSGSHLVLLSVLAFVLPVVVSVVTVQSIESRAGSATAAITGLAAAGLTAATSAGIVRRFACQSAFRGANR